MKSTREKFALKKITLLLLGVLSIQASAGEEYVGVQGTQYKESDSRLKVDYQTFSLLKDFGADFTLNVNVTRDSISGASPMLVFGDHVTKRELSGTTSASDSYVKVLPDKANAQLSAEAAALIPAGEGARCYSGPQYVDGIRRDSNGKVVANLPIQPYTWGSTRPNATNADGSPIMIPDSKGKLTPARANWRNDCKAHDGAQGIAYANVGVKDVRNAADLALTYRLPESRDELTLGLSYSQEGDYKSKGVSAQYLHYLDPSKNRSISAGLSILDNKVAYRFDTPLNYPNGWESTTEWRSAKYYNAQVGITQVFSPTVIASVNLFAGHESGALSSPYQTVARKDDYVNANGQMRSRYYLYQESRPDERNLFGINITGNKRLVKTLFNQPITVSGAYRFYHDTWGQNAHSLKGNVYLGDVDRGGQFMLGGRLSKQTAADFFRDPLSDDFAFGMPDKDPYASSDERMGKMTTLTAEVGYEKRFNKHWRVMLHGAYQKQNSINNMSMRWITAGLRYDF